MLMRSKLFVPGSRPELFSKAVRSAADAISFDLEDAVAKDRKAGARAFLSEFLRSHDGNPRQAIVVRVNAVGTEHFEADMEAVVGPWLHAVNLPMVEDPSVVLAAAAALDRLEAGGAAGTTRILVNIETPRGLRRAAELAAAHPRVAGLQIGYADLMEPSGLDRFDRDALAYVRLAVRFAAAEAGVAAFDGAYPAVSDPEGYLAECAAAHRQGFAGKSCIHPSQITIANQAFRPTVKEIDRSRRVLAAAADAEANGVGAFLLDGQMVDEPFVNRARAVVALADVYAAAPPGAGS